MTKSSSSSEEEEEKKSDLGVFGMGVMGQNLALNVASKNFSVSCYNRKDEFSDRLFEALEIAKNELSIIIGDDDDDDTKKRAKVAFKSAHGFRGVREKPEETETNTALHTSRETSRDDARGVETTGRI